MTVMEMKVMEMMKRSIFKQERALFSVLCGLLGFLLGLGWPADRAEACSAPDSMVHERKIQPKDKATNVPLNARILVSYELDEGFEGISLTKGEIVSLQGPSGKMIATKNTTYTTGRGSNKRTLLVMQPVQDLLASTTYKILSRLKTIPCGNRATPCEPSQNPHAISSFTTGTGTDTKAPVFGGAKSLVCGSYDHCNSSACCGPYARTAFSLKWEEAKDDGSFPVRYNVYSKTDLKKPLLPLVTFRGARGYIRHSGNFHFPSWLNLEGSPVAGFVVRAVDIAGNEDTNVQAVSLARSCPQPRRDEAGDENTNNPDGGEVVPDPDAGPDRPPVNDWDDPGVVDKLPPKPDTTTTAPDTKKPDTGAPDAGKPDTGKPDKGKEPPVTPTNTMGCQVSKGAPLGSVSFIACLLLGLCFTRRKA